MATPLTGAEKQARALRAELESWLLCLLCGHQKLYHRSVNKHPTRSACSGRGCMCSRFMRPTKGSGLYEQPHPKGETGEPKFLIPDRVPREKAWEKAKKGVK